MPTYEYACSACGNEWDQVQRITEPPVEVCPKCGKSEAHRLISRGTGFILKGGGWYSDLYSSSKPAAKSEGSSDASSKSESKSESKSDGGSKSESKSDGGSKSESKSDASSSSSTSTSSASSASSSSS